MERRLGRGLGTLLGNSTAVQDADGAQELPVGVISPNPHQPRRNFDEASLRELASSLTQHGFLQPIVVRPSGSGYELIAGERRWRAARLAGLERIPAFVREGVTDGQMLELALVENVQREDLDPIERALGYRNMLVTLELTQEAVAKKVGLQRATVANHLRLLDLPSEVQMAVSKGLVTMGHARALLAIESRQVQLATLARISREGLSVRQVEAMSRSANGSKPVAGSVPEPLHARKSWTVDLENRLRERLGTKVAIRNGKGYRGQIVIDYFDRNTLERVCEAIAPATPLD